MNIKQTEHATIKTALLVNGEPIDYSSLPEGLQEGMRLYMEYQILPGSFLMAVLTNDLREACSRADLGNRAELFYIISWLYNHAPGGAWGNPHNVQKWLNNV